MRLTPQLPWLDPAEREKIVSLMLKWGLIRFSNERDLPLKSGGKTDIYINLREARNHPEAISLISWVFENPLRRLNPDRFIEIPDAVSCFAGPLSIATNIPYITIRESPKTGRVGKATSIGSAPFGSISAMLDDVITDGASKEFPFIEAKKMGLKPDYLIVLVDRQQGWKEKFAELGMDVCVWPGMTLHDVRKILISDLGIMQRCDSETEEKNPIIVALDNMEWEQALPIIDPLRTTGTILKVNDMLVGRGIETLIPDLSVYGRVMGDLKCHDIPNTIENVCRRLKKYPPWAVTVHASGGGEMVKAAVLTLKGTPTKVLAITVLTSIDPVTCEEIYSRRPMEEVKVLARIAVEAGAQGFVCSKEEVSMLKALYPDKITVVPGIRSEGVDANDQSRTGTPAGAIANGADYIVLGRQVTNAKDPVAELLRVKKEELGIA